MCWFFSDKVSCGRKQEQQWICGKERRRDALWPLWPLRGPDDERWPKASAEAWPQRSSSYYCWTRLSTWSGLEIRTDISGICACKAAAVMITRPLSRVLWNDNFPNAISCQLSFLGRIACMQCVRCGLLLQMSHVTWCVCLSSGHTGELRKNGWTDQDAVWGTGNHIPYAPSGEYDLPKCLANVSLQLVLRANFREWAETRSSFSAVCGPKFTKFGGGESF